MWTIVGIGLIIRGVLFLVAESRYDILGMVLLFGIVKYLLVFQKTAQKIAARMGKREGDVFIWSVFPLCTWILIAVMITMGVLIRLSTLPREIYSLVIAGVGLGMFIASVIFWKAWRNEAAGAND